MSEEIDLSAAKAEVERWNADNPHSCPGIEAKTLMALFARVEEADKIKKVLANLRELADTALGMPISQQWLSPHTIMRVLDGEKP